MRRQIQLNVLGCFEIRSGDKIVELRARKAQALLTYLAVESDRFHSRESLATLLWGHTGEERARHNLRQALSAIRQVGGPIVVSNDQSLSIDPEICAIDVAEFLGLVKGADAQTLAEALNGYRGDLLEGMRLREPEFEDWLRNARERLRGIACATLDRLADVLIAENKDDEAMTALGRRLAMDPACELAHRSLMGLLARKGRRSDALRQYQICVDALKRELDAEPGPDTKAAYEEVLKTSANAPLSAETGLAHAPPAPGEGGPVVAILPFDNLSDEGDRYFTDGITEDLITALSCFHDLQVIARGSTFVYRGQDVPEHEIAAALGAQYLVRGSVQRSGANVRINVQLVDGEHGRALWAHRYDRELVDVFLLQNEITSTLVSTLVGRVEEARLAIARSAPVERLEAHDILLRGKYHHHLFTAEDCRICIDMFGLAIERDPSYAIAHAWLSCGLGQAMVHNLGEHTNLVDQAQAAAERGLELDANESECHRVLAQVFLTRGDLRRSLWHQERALFLNPNDDRSVCAMGEILTFAGHAEEGEKWVRKSLRLNPYHPQRYWSHLARALFHQGSFDEALSVLDRIGRPRTDDLVYSLAASVKLGDPKIVERCTAALRVALPDFDAMAFVESLPYERAEDRELVLGALTAVL
jgi:TolB-like protein/Flp pilus assembly protein TadD